MKNLFIGVDFSKEKVDVAIIFADGLTETAARVFNGFKTTVSGYKQLVKWVEQNSYGIDSSLWLFCGENTGDYSKGLCNFLYGKGYDMWLENAKSIKDASGLRRLKSDRADASMIAEYAMRNYDKAIMYEPLSESLAQLRELFLYRQMVVRHKCSFQVRRGEKRLTLEKSPIKTMISQSGRHIVSELNKEVEKINKRIAELIKSDEELTEVLASHNCMGMTVYSVMGCGRQKGYLPEMNFTGDDINLLPKIMAFVVVEDEVVEDILADITATIGTGKNGDGKIFVTDVLLQNGF